MKNIDLKPFYTKLNRFKVLFAGVTLVFTLCSDVGVRFGLWSSSEKDGLLPYEAPDFKTFTDLVEDTASQLTYEKPSFLEHLNIFTDAFAY